MTRPSRALACLPLLVLALAGSSSAQYAERPDLHGSGSPAVDVSGRSVKNPRVRAIHSDDPSAVGGTAWLFERDPFLAYQLGRNLNFREFRERDGIFGPQVAQLSGPMPDGKTAKITANNQVSCLGCHNQPYGTPGGGASFAKDSGRGRNSPHYFGAGVVEMLALQVRREILSQADTNGDGWIDVKESLAAPATCLVTPAPGAKPIDYGSLRLDGGTTGAPSMDNIVRVWFVDADGVRVPGATAVDGRTTFGFNFELVVWGWGQGAGRSALNPTNRAFLWDPWKAHGGLDAYDPSTTDDPDGDGVSRPTLAGAEQFPATHVAPDKGATLDPLGFSRDDPDGDGHLNEISEGDLDLAEWFMLNAPRPGFAGTPEQYLAGERALREVGCLDCHTPDWTILPAGDGHPGDRRLFDLATTWNPDLARLEGELVPLYDEARGVTTRRFEGFAVQGLFSDLRHHDLGVGFEEIDYGGTRNTIWRTPPLWGVGSGFPWGHDGRALSLEEAVLLHGGEAAASKASWLAASPLLRATALEFMRRLVLYDIESLPCDVDGDGEIADAFVVAGVDTGPERFNAEWLFRVPVRIQGAVRGPDGAPLRSFAATNLERAYGLDLPLRRDSDLDGWPDAWDAAPNQVGYKDGVQ